MCVFCLQIFGICLAQNLVSDVKAVKANWWQERWSRAAPALMPSQVIKTAHKQIRPAEDREPTAQRIVTELSSMYTLVCLHMCKYSIYFLFFVVFISDTQRGNKIYHLNQTVGAMLPTLEFILYFLFSHLVFGTHVFVFMARSCTRTPVKLGNWKPWMKVRDNRGNMTASFPL